MCVYRRYKDMSVCVCVSVEAKGRVYGSLCGDNLIV